MSNYIELSTITPAQWPDYELIDSGMGRKLERFGRWIISRPEPQALWNPSLSTIEWERRAHAIFSKKSQIKCADKLQDADRGEWLLRPEMDEQWHIEYNNPEGLHIKMRMGLTSFKHVGIFPEQAANWDYIYHSVGELRGRGKSAPEVLNLFAYTGGASLAAAAAGAKVTHVDSIKQTVSWSRENMEASGLRDIRWVVEDALRFVQREVKRGKRYDGIILDPPSYGRGASGEKWVLEENILEMLTLCSQLLAQTDCFMVLNLYSMGLSAMLSRTLTEQLFAQCDDSTAQQGELYVVDSYGKRLPLGVFMRFCKLG